MNLSYKIQTFHFKKPAGTSRGFLESKQSIFLNLELGEHILQGELSIIPNLSPEYDAEHSIKTALIDLIKNICNYVNDIQEFTFQSIQDNFNLVEYPALIFSLESLDRKLRPNSLKAPKPLKINGLVWMAKTKQEILTQVDNIIDAGYEVIKLKIGSISFSEEIDILKYIRLNYPNNIEIRLDANEGFAIEEALQKLNQMAEFNIHSIEQPVKRRNWDAMRHLVDASPIAIALDEELIGVQSMFEKVKMLEHIQPDYIIIKPSLCGGFTHSDLWIYFAEKMNIGWWATSALESNIGLYDIYSWVANYNPTLPQGLGTGSLYADNAEANTRIVNGLILPI